MQGVMDHIVLNAEDVKALLQFYTEVVGRCLSPQCASTRVR